MSYASTTTLNLHYIPLLTTSQVLQYPSISVMSLNRIPPPPQWVIDLQNPPPTKSKTANSLPDPPGYFSAKSVTKKSQQTVRKPPTQDEMDTLKVKKAWEVALGPAKQLPMQAIMGYMSGNSLQIFSIMMVFML